jgi:hypothetical protein
MPRIADRPRTLAGRSAGELEGLFARGRVPDPPPDGRLRGSLLHLTLGPAGAVLAPGAAIWLGKRFDADHASGANVFSSRVHTLGRVLTPAAYRVSWPEDTRSYRALAFATSVGPGALDPGVEVLRIDYDLAANAPPFRRILDELVEVEPGVYLGQALLRRRGGHRRLAWFALEA